MLEIALAIPALNERKIDEEKLGSTKYNVGPALQHGSVSRRPDLVSPQRFLYLIKRWPCGFID